MLAAASSAEYDELYSYDGLERLSDMQRGTLNATKTALTSETFGQCWTLDATGNWRQFRQDNDGNGVWNLEQTRTANPVNEITDIAATTGPTWVTPAYDPAGNMTTLPQPQDPTSSYTATYDAWNRLVKLTDDGGSSPGSSSSSSATSSSSSGGTPVVVAEYQYDARNFRIRSGELIPGTADLEYRSLYYNEQWKLLAERMGGQTFPWVERHYVWGIRSVDDLVFRRRYKNAQGSIHADTLYALQDANWNVVATTGQTDVLPPDQPSPLSERYAYTPYGQPSFLDWDYTPLTASQYGWQYLFTGLRWNANTGLTYARNRDLHSVMGVWTSRDPDGYADGSSLYAAYFVPDGVDPWGLQDPSGMDFAWSVGNPSAPSCFDPGDASEQSKLLDEHWTRFNREHPRLGGGLRTVGGLAETALGTAAIATPEPTPTTKVLGWGAAMHGADTTWAGIQQSWTGRYYQTLTQQGLEGYANIMTGDPQFSAQFGQYGDAGAGIIFSAGSGIVSSPAQVASRVSAAHRLDLLNQGYRHGTAAALAVPRGLFPRVYRGASTRAGGAGLEGLSDDLVRNIQANPGQYGGKCAEVQCINQAMRGGGACGGASAVRAVRDGVAFSACESCSPVLKIYGVKDAFP